jgi:hypothetical protein
VFAWVWIWWLSRAGRSGGRIDIRGYGNISVTLLQSLSAASVCRVSLLCLRLWLHQVSCQPLLHRLRAMRMAHIVEDQVGGHCTRGLKL